VNPLGVTEELFSQALGLEKPWQVMRIDFNPSERCLNLYLDFPKGSRFPCPLCSEPSAVHDTTEKRWRHLNFFQHECYLTARVPRIFCTNDGVHQVTLPWARNGSGFTLLFEALAMILVREMPVAGAARILGVYDNRLWRIMEHYVDKARKNADYSAVCAIGVDETSIRKGHQYVSIVADLSNARSIFACEGKSATVLESFAKDLEAHGGSPDNIAEVSIDMSPAFISGVQEYLPHACVTFDKYHIMKIMNGAVDEVRRMEAKTNHDLKGLRYAFLKNRCNLTENQRTAVERLESLPTRLSRTIRAMHIRESFQSLYQDSFYFETGLRKWYWWASHSRLEPMKEAARMVKKHWNGIVRWWKSRISNGILEGLNSLIQAAKAKARGYRTSRNFITMIYLVTGKLDFRKVGLPT
jgi:transposase